MEVRTCEEYVLAKLKEKEEECEVLEKANMDAVDTMLSLKKTIKGLLAEAREIASFFKIGEVIGKEDVRLVECRFYEDLHAENFKKVEEFIRNHGERSDEDE